MYQDFIVALNKKYNCSDMSELQGLDLQHYTFASSTNKRAIDAIAVFEAYGFDLDGMRILDVGCAYGGFSIEAAKKGAYSYGIEISEPLYEFACLNNQNEVYEKGSCKFILTDATSPDCIEKLPNNYFDLIIVNDVFEHVYDTIQLMNNLSILGNEKAVIYFAIPNGNDMRFIAREGHSGHPGLSLIRPLSWCKLTKDKYWNIYYRQFEYYKAIFSFYGFNTIIPINYPGYMNKDEATSAIFNEYQITKNNIWDNEATFPQEYKNELNSCLSSFDKQLKYDLDKLSSTELCWKYMTGFWAGFAHRNILQLDPPIITTQRRNSAENNDAVHFSLKRNDDKLSLDIYCDFDTSDYEFAYHLMMTRQPKSLERSHYIEDMHYEWQLKAQGMYGAAIYVKHKEHEHKDYRILTQPLYYSGQ